jgi:hypothetical protein
MQQKTTDKLSWETVQRKVKDLIPYPKNPRKITDIKLAKLKEKIEKYNLAEIPIIDVDGTIVSGHQRLKAMQMLRRGEEIIDVRIPSRPLSKKEMRDLNIIFNVKEGEWDFDILGREFDPGELFDLGLDPDLFEKEKKKKLTGDKDIPGLELRPFENYDYIMFVFDDNRDFLNAITSLGLKKQINTVNGKIGMGRFLKGKKLLEICNHKQRPA